jgi:hypothetical protein
MLMLFTVASIALAIGLGWYAWHLARLERLRSDARVTALAAAIEGTSTADGSATMFARHPDSGVRSRPLLKLAVGFGMAVGIIVIIAMTGGRHDAAPPRVVNADAARSLELLSMRHERAGEDLTVTGLVRNPGPAAPGAMMAVVFAFDRQGNFVASGRAPLEFATIADGDESPFRVTVAGVKDVGRYRVSFRTESGVVRHVDRRTTNPDLVSAQPAAADPRGLLAAAN